MSQDGGKPLSDLVALGWEIVSHSSTSQGMGYSVHSVLLRKGRDHRLLVLEPRWTGNGFTAKVQDV